MPLPLGHTAIAWATYETAVAAHFQEARPPRCVSVAPIIFATFLANLPDFDVLFGLLAYGNGAAIHRGPTHGLLFALLAGYLASNLWRLWRPIPRFGFGLCFFLIFSHVAADMLLTDTPVSLFWPMEIYFSSGHSGWGQVLHMVLFRSLQDAGIVIGSLIYVCMLRFFRGKRPHFADIAFAKRRIK